MPTMASICCFSQKDSMSSYASAALWNSRSLHIAIMNVICLPPVNSEGSVSAVIIGMYLLTMLAVWLLSSPDGKGPVSGKDSWWPLPGWLVLPLQVEHLIELPRLSVMPWQVADPDSMGDEVAAPSNAPVLRFT